MAGKRNPWGSGGGAGSGSGDEPPASGADDTPPEGEAGPEAEGTPAGEPPRGPRNPWLPGGSNDGGSEGGAGRPRRSASIEDIFKSRDGQRRTGGGGGRGPQFRLPERPGGKSWFPVAVLAIVALWLGVTSIHIIQPGEQGMVTWFGGKYSRSLDSGTNFTFPFPVQTVDVENVTVIRREAIPGTDEEKLVLTADQNLVNLSYQVRWNVSDLVLYRFQLADPDETMREVAEATMRSAVAEHTLDEVLGGQGQGEIEAMVREQMQARLDAFKSGIAVQAIEVLKADAPSAVIDAFNQVLEARQGAERDLNNARRYEQQLLAQAQGEATAFNNIYEQYRLAPEVTRRRLYYETMESVLANTDKTVVETPGGVTPYLPLPELRRRAPAAPASSAATTPSQGAAQ